MTSTQRMNLYNSRIWEDMDIWAIIEFNLLRLELMYNSVKNIVVHIYETFFKYNFYIFLLLSLVILWVHLIAWLLLDVTVTAVNYFNTKHSFLESNVLKKIELSGLTAFKFVPTKKLYSYFLYTLYL